jgi:DNA-damage-inducible protein D
MAEGDPGTQLVLFDEAGEYFENLSKTNGSRYWFARDLMKALGYEDWSSFKKIINKAISACATLGIQIFDHFIQETRELGGRGLQAYEICVLPDLAERRS